MGVLQNRPVVSYVAIAFAFSWSAWAASSLFDTQVASFALIVVGGFGPMVGAVTMVALRGPDSVRSWLRRQLQFRTSLRWYALALGLPLLFPVAIAAYLAVTGTALQPAVVVDRTPMYLGSLVFVFLLGGGQEEFGWRGYMLPRLLDRWDAVRASLVLGVVWAGWHLPLYVLPGQLYANKPFASYVLLVVAVTFVFTWLYEAGGRCLPVVMLLHAGVNSTGAFVPAPPETLASLQQTHAGTLVMAAVTVVVVLVLRATSGTWRPSIGQQRGGAGGL